MRSTREFSSGGGGATGEAEVFSSDGRGWGGSSGVFSSDEGEGLSLSLSRTLSPTLTSSVSDDFSSRDGLEEPSTH